MKQNSILSYFQRTPKAATTPAASPASQSKKSSPSTPTTTTKGSSSTDTPVSSRVNDSKRRPNEQHDSSVKKRIRVEDSPPVSFSGKEFTEGELVWCKMDTFPWWPAMVRAEVKDSNNFHRANRTEYHVQFFDEPPTRAWMRKKDIKSFGGSSDGAVPPAKNDRAWVTACKTADNALPFSPKKRLEKYWHEFDEMDEDGEEEEVLIETPKSVQQPKKRRRIQVIEDSSDEEEKKEDKKQQNANNKPVNGSKGENGTRAKNGFEENEEDDEYKPLSDASSSAEEMEIDDDDAADVSEEEISDELSPEPNEKSKKKSSARGKKGKNSTRTLDSSVKGSSTLVSKVVGRMKNNKPYRCSPTSSRAGLNTPVSASKRSSSRTPGQLHTPSTSSVGVKNKKDEWLHLTLNFLKPENVRDAARKRPDDPDYDPRTLYVPPDFKESCTPAVRQWWDMKAKNYDTMLFFKLGKFYELYHMDAVTAVEELGIDFMKGELAHCGFPEISYSKFSSVLVEKGYKVARIEQTETPEMMSERLKRMGKTTKFDKVVKREICQVTTKGARCATFQDEMDGSPLKSESLFLFGVIEKPGTGGLSDVGVCFVDTTIGKFHIGQFQDDKLFSRLRTVFSHYAPAQILLEKGAKLSAGFQNLLNVMTGVRKDLLVSGKEFWTEKTTLQTLNEEQYFWDASQERSILPDNLKQFVSKYDHLCLTPEKGYELGIRSFGAVIWYLKMCLLEFDLLSMKDFEMYRPLDSLGSSEPRSQENIKQNFPKYMVLDSETLKNLDITEGETTLLSKLDYCGTPFGKRLLRHWVCMPLANPKEITERLDAVEELMTLTDVTATITPILKKLPDLERLMSKVHTLGSEHRGKHHPDSRAFFFEETKYSKRKVADLLCVLKGFKACVKIINAFQDDEVVVSSSLLSSIVTEFPPLDDLLHYFDNAFDHGKAVKDGKIIPTEGTDMEYDSCCEWMNDLQTEIDAYLREIGKDLRCKVVWFGTEKRRFQIEIPDNVRVPASFEISSSRKGFKRYHTKKTKDFLERTLKAEANREIILKDLMRRVFEKVDSHRNTWSRAIKCIGLLDVLLSLARYSLSQEEMCRPKVVYSTSPFLHVVDGRHPCVPQDSFIPNSSQLGSVSSDDDDADEPARGVFALLTGPNMGGKSTLEKTMGLLAILAQIGTFVPASKCELSVVDRIFTRVGANDNISEGESTFFVEMSETASVLKHATSNSLVLMDELGRGTATYDGTAIAYAVTKSLVNLGCRCYFSTHYHTLVEAVQTLQSIQLGHMACMIENENEVDPTEETITFLYKLAPGACPKSYGFNAARLAGLPKDVVREAHKKAKELEQETCKIDLFRKLTSRNNFLSLGAAKAIKV